MIRISSNMQNQGFLHYDRLSQVDRDRLTKQIDSQHRIALPSDDPVNASHSVRLQSKISRLAKYQDNANRIIENYAIAEGNLNEIIEVLQRTRELAVQAGNGLLSKEDLKYIATEVNEYLEELVNIANQKGLDGLALFAGTKTDSSAFHIIRGRVLEADGLVVTDVRYSGNNLSREIQFSDNTHMQSHFPGNVVFWAENQKIFGANRLDDFAVTQDSTVIIDGQELSIKAGDSVHTIASRINQANISVKASIDPVNNVFVLTGTTPHQIWISEKTGGTVLTDLGLTDTINRETPNNLNSDALVSGGSIFDMVIGLRDALYSGDVFKIGGSSLGGIDSALDNVNLHRTKIGSKHNRIENSLVRLSYEENQYKTSDNLARGLSMTDALSELAALSTALQASYKVASSNFQSTLMDFLK